MKSRIIEQIGETDILVPSLIGEGLAANDRVKARLSTLQAAARHARDPQGPHFDLTEEWRAAGIDSTAMEALVNGAGAIAGDRVAAPGLDKLLVGIWDDVDAMIRAVNAGDAPTGEATRQRVAALKPKGTVQVADSLEFAAIGRLTAISSGQGDSLHRLVMDLHKALNRLTVEEAEEVLAGAHVYGLAPQDRPVVEAFMRGIEATYKLKFDHPGLATMATRAGRRLTIQNDLGETDAHVVVIAVEALTVTVTYTDVHPARAKFFTGLLRNFPMQWSGLDRKSAEGLGDGGVFYLVTGRFAAADDKARDAFLEALGGMLVFLIDWNKARKVLRNWVSKGDAVDILDWAARQRVGHRGFLALGGAELVAAAVHHATPARIGFGDRLDRALGRAAAVDFLKTVLRVSTEELLEGGSVRLARDRIEADLLRHLQRLDGMLLAIVMRQAGLACDIAVSLARFVAEQQHGRAFDRADLAVRARRIEEKADRIAIDARNEIARFNADPSIARLVNEVEQAIDELEQAAFICPLVPDEIHIVLLEPLSELAAAAVAGAEAAAAGAAAAVDVPEGQRVDSEDALATVARLIEAEHAADAAERAVTAILLRGDFDLKTALSVLELARAIERSTDRFAAFGHVLRGRVIADLSA